MAIKTGKPSRKGAPTPISEVKNLDRPSSEQIVMLNVEMPYELRQQIKLRAVEQHTDISKVIRKLARNWLLGNIRLDDLPE